MRLCLVDGCDRKHYGKGFCKPCYMKNYKASKPAEYFREACRRSYQNCKEQRLAEGREWKLANTERVRENIRRWQRANKDKVAANTKAWVSKNRERIQEVQNEYRKQPHVKAKLRAYDSSRAKANPLKFAIKASIRRTRQTQAGGSFSVDEWAALVELFSSRCAACNEAKPLTADHTIPVAWGGPSWIWNIQPLCKSCNCAKNSRMIIAYTPPGLQAPADGYIFDE